MWKYPILLNEEEDKLKEVIRGNTKEADTVKRAQAILMVSKHKEIREISEMTGFSRSQIFELRKQYVARGIEVLTDKRKGKPKELLTKKQRGEIIHTLATKTPNECDAYYNSDYWTTGILGEYIKRVYNVGYKSKTSLYLLFRQAKFTYHKPGREYERRDAKEVSVWQENIKPIIQKAWNDPHVVIVTEDEMVLSTQTTVQKIWLRQGEYPKIEVAKKRESRSIYGFLNIKTGKEHAFKTKWQNMYITKRILKKIRKIYPTQQLLLIWDQAGWHKGREVQEMIDKDRGIKTIYFPAAAPEQNPQEKVWKSGRSNVSHNRFIKNIDKATNDFVTYLNTTTFPYKFLEYSPIS